MEPTVSAIITTYNYGRFIAGGVESALRQTRRPDEIVVVDDGSTDDTAEIVARYEPDGVRYVHKENGGVSSARNAGLRATTGQLVAFLDSDDRWLPEKTALQVEHFRRYPAVGLVTGTEYQVNQESGEKVLVRRKAAGAAWFYHRTLIENWIGNSSVVMIRRDALESAGSFDEGVGLGQDWDTWIRIARRYPIGVIDVPLMHFNFHSGSLTAGRVEGRLASNRDIRRRYIGQLGSPLLRLQLSSAALSMSHFYAAASLSESDDPARRWPARRSAALALALDPTYEAKPKAALLFRVLFGRGAFNRVRDLVAR